MPLLEWHVGEIVTDFPSTYQVKISPSPWKAALGDALDDGSYILQEIRVIGNGSFCRKENISFVVRRSPNDLVVEQGLNGNLKNYSWLFAWGLSELILSSMYVWWFIIKYKHGSPSQVATLMGTVGCISVFLILVSRVLGPQLGYAGISDCFGTVTLTAKLLKVHYETLIVLLVCILAELVSLGVIVSQVIRAGIEKKQAVL
jgi:hypothetical protein